MRKEVKDTPHAIPTGMLNKWLRMTFFVNILYMGKLGVVESRYKEHTWKRHRRAVLKQTILIAIPCYIKNNRFRTKTGYLYSKPVYISIFLQELLTSELS